MFDLKNRTWQRRLIRGFVIYVLVPYATVTAIMVAFQRRLIFQPTTTGRLLAESVTTDRVAVEDVEIPAAGQLTLHGWLFRSESTDDEEEKFLVLYFPGNAGCRRDRISDCRDFTRLGCDVLIFDYRGYGDSGGSPGEELLSADARRAWLYAISKFHYAPQRILFFGESLGGAVATRLAAELSNGGIPPAALVLNSTFAALSETVAWHYPAFPFQYLLWDRFPSVRWMPHVACPVLQFHGTDDSIVPIAHGRRLFDTAPEQSSTGIGKRFVTIPGGEHNFITVSDMQASVRSLLDQLREIPVTENEAPAE